MPNMPRKYKKPEIGDTYGLWTIIAVATRLTSRNAVWLCRCVCGVEAIVYGNNLVNGNSLGCRECCYKNYKHYKTQEYSFCPYSHRYRLLYRFNTIKQRCFDESNSSYKNYGARGITLYEPWVKDPVAFLKYLMTLPGWDDPKLTIDRINNDGNYEPGNLRFATRQQQALNQRHRVSSVKSLVPSKE